jgi:signal peptidase I
VIPDGAIERPDVSDEKTDVPTKPNVATAPHRRAPSVGCLIDIAGGIVLAIVAYFVVTTFIAQPYEVEQDSMRTAVEEGQYVLVDKLTPHFDGYSRGDIVVFSAVRREACQASESVPLPGSAPYIKRVIGEPRDVVELRDGLVYVNGALLAEPYVEGPVTGPDSAWVVPQGRLFVMGDNRPGSIDSRSDQIGAICIDDIIGRAVLRYWPINKMAVLQSPTYENVPPATVAEPGATSSPGASVAHTLPPGSTAVPTTPTTVPATATPAAPVATPPASGPPTAGVEDLRVEVIGRRPHDVTSYTEGLALVDGRLYESSGYGATLREVDPHTGALVRSVTMDGGYSAEGIAVVGDRVIQLTLQHTALVYRLSDFRQVGTFTYDTEGWGLCDDGTRLVMSDGTSQLYFRDRSTFALLGAEAVTNAGVPVDRLNELECVDGEVYANVWLSDTILRIDPSTGNVTAVIDASGLLPRDEVPGDEEAVLNGIAYDTTTKTFLLTGKLWPALFEVHFLSP